jgi:hypothetical protein
MYIVKHQLVLGFKILFFLFFRCSIERLPLAIFRGKHYSNVTELSGSPVANFGNGIYLSEGCQNSLRTCQRVLVVLWSSWRLCWITSGDICKRVSSLTNKEDIVLSIPPKNLEVKIKLKLSEVNLPHYARSRRVGWP